MSLVKHSQRTVRRGCNTCGRKDLYWAHDTSELGEYCAQCGTSGKWVLIDMNGEKHVHSKDGVKDDVKSFKWMDDEAKRPFKSFQDFAEEERKWNDVKNLKRIQEDRQNDQNKAKEDMKKAAQNGNSGELEDAFRTLIDALGPKVDENTVREIVKEQFNNVVFPTRTVTISSEGVRKEIEGKTHSKLADVLTDLSAGEHVLMVGPAGTGKSTIAEQCAEALSMKFYSISLSPMTAASQILGYMQAEGNYVRTLFREAYENGGVFHFDEFDNGHPSILAVVNSALANGQMAFPDTMVKRHADFRCVASANTYGRGPDRQYVGRQQLDAATLDRFAVETIEIDEALENDLCHATGLETAKVQRVLTYIRALRASAERQQMAVIISPRASVGMCRLLKAGRSSKDAIEARVRRGLSDAQWKQLTDTVPRF